MIYEHHYESQRTYFDTGATLPFHFRKGKLRALKGGIIAYSDKISQALMADLRKNAAEAYTMEIDFVLAEIDHQLAHLKKWMKPRKVATPLSLEWSSSKIYPQPKGVVLIISPWNFPFQLSMAPVVAALGAGCTILLKPSEMAPHTAQVMQEMIDSLFESQHVCVLQGSGEELVPELLDKHAFNHVFFTGSTAVGRKIAEMASKHLSSTTLELGGKSPTVISASAHIKTAAKRIAWGKFANCGQACIAPDYLLVERSIAVEFKKELISSIKSFYTDNAEQSPDYGRIINESRFDALAKMLEGNKIIYGGKMNKADRYMEPTLIDTTDLDSALMKEEIFGPILPIITFDKPEEALAIMRRNPYPLTAYYFGTDPVWEELFRTRLTFGGGTINNVLYHISNPDFPFGGIQGSGTGSYHGEFGFNTFTHQKGIMKTANWLDIPVKYPPFNTFKLKWLKRILTLSRSMHF